MYHIVLVFVFCYWGKLQNSLALIASLWVGIWSWDPLNTKQGCYHDIGVSVYSLILDMPDA